MRSLYRNQRLVVHRYLSGIKITDHHTFFKHQDFLQTMF